MMFTGLIEKVGTLGNLRRTAEGGQLTVHCDEWQEPLVPGESIAVQGACLTVVTARPAEFVSDVLEETLRRTRLLSMSAGARLNLERAMRLDGRFGGHMVTGHVDGLGTVTAVRSTGRDWELHMECAPELLRGIVVKGSIAIDGVSLTVSGVNSRGFTVNIIPFTWQNTSLCSLDSGCSVNLETDIIGKYVARHLSGTAPGPGCVTIEALAAAGFGG
jgi:riboflavin synthase